MSRSKDFHRSIGVLTAMEAHAFVETCDPGFRAACPIHVHFPPRLDMFFATFRVFGDSPARFLHSWDSTSIIDATGVCRPSFRPGMTGTVRVAAGRPAMLSGMKMQMDSQGRLTLTQAAGAVGVSPKTIIRWEKAGRIACPKRDWRGWRVFTREQVDEMIRLRERLY